jgi:hypothetical protein
MGTHPIFAPDQQSQFLDFFEQNNYAVVSDALPPEDIQFLNDFVDHSERERPVEWHLGEKPVYSHAQILVHYPELDPYIQAPVTFPLVKAILGPDVRFSQFDFRDVPVGAGDNAAMRFHRDLGYYPPAGANPKKDRFPDTSFVCAIIYLNDVDEETPCFCVVPNSHLKEYTDIEATRTKMGASYAEIPIRGPAGTAVLYNINIYHTRLPGRVDLRRLTQHCYFSCETSPTLTNWVMIPQRLTEHPDPEKRTYFSQWPEATQKYADADYSPEYYDAHVMGKPT